MPSKKVFDKIMLRNQFLYLQNGIDTNQKLFRHVWKSRFIEKMVYGEVPLQCLQFSNVQ